MISSWFSDLEAIVIFGNICFACLCEWINCCFFRRRNSKWNNWRYMKISIDQYYWWILKLVSYCLCDFGSFLETFQLLLSCITPGEGRKIGYLPLCNFYPLWLFSFCHLFILFVLFSFLTLVSEYLLSPHFHILLNFMELITFSWTVEGLPFALPVQLRRKTQCLCLVRCKIQLFFCLWVLLFELYSCI